MKTPIIEIFNSLLVKAKKGDRNFLETAIDLVDSTSCE